MTEPASSEKAFEKLLPPTCSREDIEDLQNHVEQMLGNFDFEASAIFSIRLAIEEALTNAIRHGNKKDKSKSVSFKCRVGVDEGVFEIADEGAGFNPETVPDPTEEANIEIPSGRGIMLMRAYMSDVQFEHPGNKVILTYRRSE